LSGGTDGEDGPTDAAGAVADAETLSIMEEHGLNAADYLQRHDAYHFFERVGGESAPPAGLIKTGLTGTNVMDVRVVLVR
jgi:glycerate-2-kinase